MRHPSHRRSIIAIVILAIVVAGMGAAIWRANAGKPGPTPTASPGPTGSGSPTPGISPSGAPTATQGQQSQPTLLVQLRDDYLSMVDSVLMGVQGPKSQTSQIYFPADVVVDLSKGQSRILQDTGTLPLEKAGQMVAAQSGSQVGGTFAMDRLAFAGLVDAVGGVELTIKTPVVAKDGYGNVLTIVPLGQRTLDGPSAAVYAMYLAPNEPEINRIQRFKAVWNAVLAKLPPQAEKVRAILGSLGALARSTQPVEVVAAFLTQAGDNVREAKLASGVAHTYPGSLGPLPISWITPAKMSAQVASLLPWALITPSSPQPRVRVHQQGSVFVSAEVTKDALVAAGYTFVWAGPSEGGRTPLAAPSEEPQMASTTSPPAGAAIVVATEDDRALGESVAKAVGITGSTIRVDPALSPGAPVTIYLPETLAPPPTTGLAPVTSSGS